MNQPAGEPSVAVLLTYALDDLRQANGLVRGAHQAYSARRPTRFGLPFANRRDDIEQGHQVTYSGDAFDRARTHLRSAIESLAALWAHPDATGLATLRSIIDRDRLDDAVVDLRQESVPMDPKRAADHLRKVAHRLADAEAALQHAATLRSMGRL